MYGFCKLICKALICNSFSAKCFGVLITPKPTLNKQTVKKNKTMDFSRKIYYNDKPLIITTDKEAYLISDPVAEEYEFFAGASLRSYTMALRHLERPGMKGAIIEDISEPALLEQLYAMYMPLDAAGGVAYNEQGDILMIFRRGKWDLPKGKLDAGESIDECALR